MADPVRRPPGGARQHRAPRRAPRVRPRRSRLPASPITRSPTETPKPILRAKTYAGARAPLRQDHSAKRSATSSTTNSRIIAKLGFCGYFLIVWDIVNFAREQGHPRPGPRHRRQLRRLLLASASPPAIPSATNSSSSASSARAATPGPTSISTSPAATAASPSSRRSTAATPRAAPP